MTSLYITRHGETVWNSEKRMQGWNDSPLTELGIKQGKWLGERLDDVKFDAIYSSPSGRAFETAKIIRSGRKIDINKLDALREINLGDWEGKTFSEVKEENPEQFYNFFHAAHLYNHQSGESFYDVSGRVVPEVERIISEHPDGNILIVTHTVTLKLIMAHFENRPLNKLWDLPFIHQTSLSVVNIKEKNPHILLHGDISHFKEECTQAS